MGREWRQAALAAALMLSGLAAHAQTPDHSGRAAPMAATAGSVTVQARPITATYSAYAQVQPIAPLLVRAVEPGIVAQMSVVPGSTVKAGESLARLTGPEIESLLVHRRGAVRSARSRLAAARRNLAIDRRQLATQLSTQQAVAAAQSAVAAARAAFNTAQAQLHVAREMRTLRAPSAGTVLAVNASEGERVAAGQTVLTLQTNSRLWLRAVYYGADAAAVRIGMTGQFQPASGAARVAVRVVAVSAAIAADGGQSVGLVAAERSAPTGRAAAAPWLNGERGTVILTGPTKRLIAVPSRALVLDQARWWVLVRTSKGLQRRAVVPGPTRGWETFIEQGLSPGEHVVVENAYLEFHRGIAQRYTPPD